MTAFTKRITAFVITLALLSGPFAQATGPGLTLVQIRRAIQRYMTETDPNAQEKLMELISDQMHLMDPGPFNELIGEIVVDYVRNPDHRIEIMNVSGGKLSGLIPGIRSSITDELAREKPSRIVTISYAVALAWVAAYSVVAGKELAVSSGAEIVMTERLANAARLARAYFKESKLWKTIVYALGAAAGEAYYEGRQLPAYNDKKVDPVKAIEANQMMLIRTWTARMVQLRNLVYSRGTFDALAVAKESHEILSQATQIDPSILPSTDDTDNSKSMYHGKIVVLSRDLLAIRTRLCQMALTMSPGDRNELEQQLDGCRENGPSE